MTSIRGEDRRRQILDAALTILGAEGPRSLTHRAVDRELGLPLGSTANHFPKREDLLRGIVSRLEEHDRALWAAAGERPADSPEELAHRLTAFIVGAADEGAPGRLAAIRHRARYHLQLSLPEKTAATHRALGEELGRLIGVAGGAPGRSAVLLAAVDGLLLRAVTYGAEALPDPEQMATGLLRLILRD